MKKNIEDALKTILSSEQVTALKEEIATAMKKINSAVESNKKMNAKKELLVESLNKVDKLIETSERSPVMLKAFYSAAKINLKKFIQPIIEKIIEEEDISGLDDIPDAPVKKEAEKKPEKKPEEKQEHRADQKQKTSQAHQEKKPEKSGQKKQFRNNKRPPQNKPAEKQIPKKKDSNNSKGK